MMLRSYLSGKQPVERVSELILDEHGRSEIFLVLAWPYNWHFQWSAAVSVARRPALPVRAGLTRLPAAASAQATFSGQHGRFVMIPLLHLKLKLKKKLKYCHYFVLYYSQPVILSYTHKKTNAKSFYRAFRSQIHTGCPTKSAP